MTGAAAVGDFGDVAFNEALGKAVDFEDDDAVDGGVGGSCKKCEQERQDGGLEPARGFSLARVERR
jgi:hypothetical protein